MLKLPPSFFGTGGERIRRRGLFSSGRRLAKFCGRGARRRENLWPIQQRNNVSELRFRSFYFFLLIRQTLRMLWLADWLTDWGHWSRRQEQEKKETFESPASEEHRGDGKEIDLGLSLSWHEPITAWVVKDYAAVLVEALQARRKCTWIFPGKNQVNIALVSINTHTLLRWCWWDFVLLTPWSLPMFSSKGCCKTVDRLHLSSIVYAFGWLIREFQRLRISLMINRLKENI
jgi:hypothetical protein